MSRLAPCAVLLAGCSFYISGGPSDGGSIDQLPPDTSAIDATIDDATSDAPLDVVSPPFGDATVDSLIPPPDSLIPPLDGLIPPLDGLIPPLDGLIPPFDAGAPDAMPPGDAGMTPDAMGPVWTVIETLVVPCTNAAVSSQTVLVAGTAYRLRASGQCTVNTLLNTRADAEYQGVILPADRANGVDVGIAIDDLTPGFTKQPHWGSYSASHVYQLPRMGAGATITAKFHSSSYNNNAGSLTLQILQQL